MMNAHEMNPVSCGDDTQFVETEITQVLFANQDNCQM